MLMHVLAPAAASQAACNLAVGSAGFCCYGIWRPSHAGLQLLPGSQLAHGPPVIIEQQPPGSPERPWQASCF